MSFMKSAASLEGHLDRVWHVAWEPNQGRYFTSSSADKTIRLWKYNADSNSCSAICVLQDAHNRTVRSTAWAPGSTKLASASFDGTVCVWSRDETSDNLEVVATIEGHENEVKSVSWNCSGNLLATCGRDKTVWIWEADEDNDFECISILSNHNQDVKKVLFHPERNVLFSCGYDSTIRMYEEDPEMDDWNCVQTLENHGSTVWSLDTNRDASALASVSDDLTLKIWKAFYQGSDQGVEPSSSSVPRYKCDLTLSGDHSRPIYDVAWNRLSNCIATAAGDDSICLYKPENLSSNPTAYSLLTKCEHAHSRDVNSLAWNPVYDNVLLSASDDETVKLWNVSYDQFGTLI
ncbi:probable cytosolic iron-sulfur protein assembly protein CIAO1 homolog [Symsagittifera roscoffensis]|uniref:probable cytosolic iron-sulfur protein assembly protein CIAO1 homolog n=1 Tax=Symsagittifera roscoffensis TaxID=84072 RepID=UPI00307C790F